MAHRWATFGMETTGTSIGIGIIIAVYNDWVALDECLRSIAQQADAPSFAVFVVDDGSEQSAPENIQQWAGRFPLHIVRQSHAGISVARNRGIMAATEPVLLFVDADCRLRKNCLATLTSTIARSPQHDCFQLRLTGSGSTVVGRAEELRLATFQEHALQPDGRIRYLNTAGFAIRRARAQNRDGLFDPVAQRGEDTLLLANLMKRDELPLFVADAVVEHSISLSLIGCLGKDIRSAYLECKTYEMIDSKGVEIRITNRERLQLLGSMWKAASQPSIGRVAWVVVVGRQALQRIISLGYRWLRIGAIRSTRNVNRQR
ncbi:MAG: glycosyltransferase family A protein [Terriglobales bacterium]